MDVNRPKRRKDKYNPYTIFEHDGKFYVSFKDFQGIKRSLEISKELFDVFNEFELEDLATLNEWDRYIEHSELTEESLSQRALNKQESVETAYEHAFECFQLKKVISELPEKQRRRFEYYYFQEMTYLQIAEKEGCTLQAVAKSIAAAENKLKKFLDSVI